MIAASLLALLDEAEQTGQERNPLPDRFWSKVNKTENCWLWIACVGSNGYAQIRVGGRKGRMVHAHRVSWYLHNGPIPNNLLVLHSCDIPVCVKPDHLFLGTNRDNVLDAVKKGRRADFSGDKAGAAKLSWSFVRQIRSLYRDRNYTMTSLAEQFNVSITTISEIIHNMRWIEPEAAIREEAQDLAEKGD